MAVLLNKAAHGICDWWLCTKNVNIIPWSSFIFPYPCWSHTSFHWGTMLPLHITGFPPSYIPYQRHPPCSLFPIEAHPLSGIIRGSQTWMIFEQPYDPISLGMDICILSRDTPETSRVGTVRACCVVVDSWVVYRVELHSALSAKTLLLYVPVIWADVSSHVTGRSHIQE